jgi:hypothetical protein
MEENYTYRYYCRIAKVGDATLQVDGMSLMKKIFPFGEAS